MSDDAPEIPQPHPCCRCCIYSKRLAEWLLKCVCAKIEEVCGGCDPEPDPDPPCCAPACISLVGIQDPNFVGPVELFLDEGFCAYTTSSIGTEENGFIDYYAINVGYNEAEGRWEAGGNSNVYATNELQTLENGDPCNPFGTYEGGGYTVVVSECTN